MLFKNGDSNDLMRYNRCLGLLPHSYKVLSLIILERLQKECSKYLADWQAGFRTERGCRDNLLLLRILFDMVIENNDEICITFIDSIPQVERAAMAPPQMPQYTATASAASYPAKDAREMFFRPHGGRAKPPAKRSEKRRKIWFVEAAID